MLLAEAKKVMEEAGIKVQTVDALKGSCKVQGLSIGDGRIRPTLYASSIETMDEAELIEFARRSMEHVPQVDLAITKDREYILANCVSCIRHQTDDERSVKWSAYGDLEEYVRLNLGSDGDAAMTTVITREFLESAGISEEELHIHARKNLKDTVRIQSMSEVLSGLMGMEEVVPEPCDSDLQMWVASNTSRVNGAAVMLLRGVLRDFCADHGLDSVYIIPSSLHEVILTSAKIPMVEINSMIEDVNETQVNEWERLSDHVYTFFAA